MWRILQNMPTFPYKTQVQIVVAFMALHKYIRRKSRENVVFIKFNRHPNFVFEDILIDVVPRSQTHENKKPLPMIIFMMRL